MQLGWKQLRRLPRPLWVLALATLINRAGTMALPFLALYLTRDRGFTIEGAGIVVGAFGIGALITGPLGGWLCDRWGATRLMLTSLVTSGLLLLLFPLAQSYEAIFLTTLLWAITVSVFRPAAYSAIADLSVPEDRQIAFALNRMAINLGMSVGPALGGVIVLYSFHAIFWVDGITTLLAGAIVAWEFGWKRAGEPVAEHVSFFRSMKLALSDLSFCFVLLALIPVQIVFFQHETTLPLYLVHDLGMKESVYGLLFTVNTLVIILVEIQFNLWLNRWHQRVSIALGCLLFAIGFGLMGYVNGMPMLLFATLVWTFGEMALFPGATTYLSEISPPGRRGAYMGLYATSFSIAQTIAPLAGTFLMERFSSSVLWGTCFGLGTTSALLALRLGKRG